MAKKRKTHQKPAKARVTRTGPKKSKPARAARAAGEGDREVHYTDLRKVMLANALKRLR